MEKKFEESEQKFSMASHLQKFWERQHMKSIVKELKPFSIDEDALVSIRGSRVAVLSTDACKQIEQLAKMTISVTENMAFVEGASTKGRGITFLNKLILPDKGTILEIKENPAVSRAPDRTLFGLVCEIINSESETQRKSGLEILNRIKDIKSNFVDPNIELEDIFRKKWQIVSYRSPSFCDSASSRETKYYRERVSETHGDIVSNLHIHPYDKLTQTVWYYLSPADIKLELGVEQFWKKYGFEWFGIVGVDERIQPQDFRFDKSKLVLYNIDQNSIFGRHSLRKDETSLKSRGYYHSLVDHFDESHKARTATWGELLSAM